MSRSGWPAEAMAMFGVARLRAIASLVSGSLGAIVLGALFLPVVARIYPVEVLGHYYTFLAAVTLAGAAMTLRLEMAIVVAGEEDRTAVVSASLLVVAIVAGIGGIAWGLFVTLAPVAWLPAGWTTPMKAMLVLAAFANGLSIVASQVLLSAGRYSVIARNRIVQVLFSNGLVIGVGLVWPVFEVLVVAQVLSLCLVLFAARDLLRDAAGWHPAAAGIREAVSRYRDFVHWNFPSNLLNTASLQLPTILIAAWYGAEFAVYFAMANRVLDLAFGTLSGAMSQVFYRDMAEHVRQGKAPGRRVLASIGVSTLTGLVIAGVFLVAGDWIVALVLGERWGTVASVIPVLLTWRVVQFVNQPVSTIYSVLRRQEVALLLILVFFAPRLWLLSTGDDFLVAVGRYTLATALFYLTYILTGLWLATRGRRDA